MSKNARNKLRAKRRHRDQFGILPRGTDLAFLIKNVSPARTALMGMIDRLIAANEMPFRG